MFLLFARTSAPANAQFGFGGGDGGMASMLEMDQGHLGKPRFAMLMQTIGPMIGQTMENGICGFGSMGSGRGIGA